MLPKKSPPQTNTTPSWLVELGWADRYQVIDLIGFGGMGQVWRAREIATEQVVAMKVIDPARTGDEHLLARLESEADALLRLRDAGQHEHIVPILDFKITEHHACLVMAFIAGQDLRTWCDMHRLDLHKRVALLAKAARAAGWCHQHGIVHRDLKPANILVHSATGEPVVVDFSIAKTDEPLALTLTNEALGTAPYMAPEQLDRSRDPISPASDVYSLGATLYELLTHVHPHPGDLAQVIKRHQNEERPARPSLLNKEVPPDLECIVLKALSHRPTDRYPDGTALADDLERFLAGQPVQARPISTMLHVVRHMRRKPALTSAVAACFVIGGFAAWNVQRQAAQREAFALEDQLTAAMQHRIWTAAELAQAETALTALNEYGPALAAEMRRRLHDDLVQDIEGRLSLNHLRDDDFAWLRSTVDWLRPRLPDQASRLESLTTERLGRWETQAELRPPFASLHGLFPRSNVEPEGSLLYARHDVPRGNPPPILITDAASVPMEIDCTFVAEGSTFHHIALDFAHQNAYLVLMLYKVQHTPASTRAQIGAESDDPQSYVLYFNLNDSFHHGIHIPDAQLLNKPFRLTLRVEREWAEATLNDQWHLRLNSPFALGSLQPNNYCRISWPSDIGLKKLALRTRRSDTTSPLEQADLLAAQGNWVVARRLYENLRGDPQFGTEADCKIGQCFWREGEHAAALAQWEKVIRRPPSLWRDRSLLLLSMQSLLSQDWEATSRYLALLPEHLPPSTLQFVDSRLSKDLSKVLLKTGLSIVNPRIDHTEVSMVAKAFQVLQTPPLELANRLAMAHHFARQDDEAEILYQKALHARDNFPKHLDSIVAATNCLDQWCRLIPSEKEKRLSDTLDRWRGALNGQAIWHMEQARRAARAGNLRNAIASIREARKQTPEKLDNRLHTSIWLLEGMLYRIQKDEDQAQQAWKKAQEIAATVTMRHPLHLFDSIIVHSLTWSWDRETAGDLLTTLASRHLSEEERPAAQIAFDRTFLTDPAWLTTFNAVLQDERGRQLAMDYALCLDPLRELVQRFYRLLFEHYFLTTAFPNAGTEEIVRVRQIVDQLVTEMATNPRGEIADLYAYLRAWNDPGAAAGLWEKPYPYSPELIGNLKWLLRARLDRL